ncbi:hypothetical protein T01_5436 [Trichinella spiralis]|uniref:Uncharacterized protein n=1 Tax=Trichinella spiralis TaxID=6334 RepID=A0A0V1AKA3_TRISP|nr:hypothetical protein T01_5436 [Trichinella spiralis]
MVDLKWLLGNLFATENSKNRKIRLLVRKLLKMMRNGCFDSHQALLAARHMLNSRLEEQVRQFD